MPKVPQNEVARLSCRLIAVLVGGVVSVKPSETVVVGDTGKGNGDSRDDEGMH